MRELWIEIYRLLAWCIGFGIFVVLFNSVRVQNSTVKISFTVPVVWFDSVMMRNAWACEL
ncbi:hypothetical protein [uncultured Campylobacter sp.]|uniref:hypothetical protein n=1 Tax=uncultured Campylobacter sp. TaxID=218934 RepID=UPI0015BDB45F|nr:hypothetical protein [uncultured Campylobacter sp.]